MQAMKEGVTIGSWAVAVFDPRCNDADHVATQLVDSCCRRGMKMGRAGAVEKEPVNAINYSPEQRVERMMRVFKAIAPDFILVILPDKDSPIYGNKCLSVFPDHLFGFLGLFFLSHAREHILTVLVNLHDIMLWQCHSRGSVKCGSGSFLNAW